jgi:hypothetical protein
MFVSLPIFFNETESLSLSLSLSHIHVCTHTHGHMTHTHNSYYTYIHTYIPLLEERNEANNGTCTKRQEFCFTLSDLLVLVYRHYGWPIISELTSGPVSSCCSDIECLSVPRSHTSITLLSCSPVRADLCKPVKRTATNSHYITKLSLTLQLSSYEYGIVENRSF